MTRSDADTLPLFAEAEESVARCEPLGAQAFVLRGHALPVAPELLRAVAAIEVAAPFRHMETPGGLRMSVAMTNCGTLGWTSDRRGYRYTRDDPQTGERWPAMPPLFLDLARSAADEAGFRDFTPDACLVNRYDPGTRRLYGALIDRRVVTPAWTASSSCSRAASTSATCRLPRAPSARCSHCRCSYGSAAPGSLAGE